jgi:hypothetical protein
MDKEGFSRCFDLLGFDVHSLSNLAQVILMQTSIMRDMCDELQFLPVGVRLDAGVQAIGIGPQFNLQCANEKKRSQG